ncbi:MAG: TraB/GumN family protein [Tabrizicola sp.]|nr:TraB/GumN family protein [Tabrizicola sp.]
MFRFAAAVLAFLIATPALAECGGENLFESMAAAERQALEAKTKAVPFAKGNYWRATRGDEVITLIGTYHFDDPRHQATLDATRPVIAAAQTVLVEAGPEEEKALLAMMARDPSIMMFTEGPSLMERVSPDLWTRMSTALAQRGIPGFMAAKLKPWYVNVLLAIPPCAVAQMQNTEGGLDGMVMDAAAAAGVPVKALEPFDTVFKLFGFMSEQEQIDLIESTLSMENRSEDFSATLADSYFAGESLLVWELMREISYQTPGQTREEIDLAFARMEDALMVNRNRAWIPVIEAAAGEGPVFVAFGALHLPGRDGVLALLEARGFAIEPVALN